MTALLISRVYYQQALTTPQHTNRSLSPQCERSNRAKAGKNNAHKPLMLCAHGYGLSPSAHRVEEWEWPLNSAVMFQGLSAASSLDSRPRLVHTGEGHLLKRYNSGEVLTCGELKWPDASETHIARHGVGPDEVEEVLAGLP